jgi:hypothetical protein
VDIIFEGGFEIYYVWKFSVVVVFGRRSGNAAISNDIRVFDNLVSADSQILGDLVGLHFLICEWLDGKTSIRRGREVFNQDGSAILRMNNERGASGDSHIFQMHIPLEDECRVARDSATLNVYPHIRECERE